jgi:DNA-directed RNA polymerase subunit RPC12/RpoP
MATVPSPLPLGELLVKMGRLSPTQLQEALQVQRRLVDQGLEKLLGDILVAKGYATGEEIRSVIQRQAKRVLVCGSCRSEFNVLENDAPGSVLVCPHCSRRVRVPADLEKSSVAVPADMPQDPGQTVPLAYLVTKQFMGEDRVQSVHRGDRVLVGHDSDCDLRLEGDAVAGKHCEILERHGEILLMDLGVGETRVNGTRVERCILRFGDLVVLGHTPLQLTQGVPNKSNFDAVIQARPHCFLGWEPSDLVGQTLDGYRILSQLGYGGMSIVYLAEQLALGRLVALKILKKDFGGNQKTIERFMREARAGAKLNHRNIVIIYNAGFYGGLGYIAMEYVDGEDVGRWIKRLGKLPLDLAVSIAVQVATALDVAHEAGVVHRDVKPSNILFSKDGVAKLLDLGIAKVMEEAINEEGKAGLGTLSYMPPEQTSNAGRADHRADIYSLGATLYKMLTGQAPYRAPTVEELVRVIRVEPLPDPRTFVPGLPEGLVLVLRRAMQKNPEDRYPNARVMRDELLAVL